jgi:hypothetical protein
MFTIDEMLPYMESAFWILKRLHFNRVRRQFQARLARMNDIPPLLMVYSQWYYMQYGEQAMHVVEKRLRDFIPEHLDLEPMRYPVEMCDSTFFLLKAV